MVYHVRITRNSRRTSDIVELDFTKKKLLAEIVEPYNHSRNFYCDGELIDPSDVERIKITTTKEKSNTLLPLVRAERAASSVITLISDEWYIADKGEDVTRKFINYTASSVLTQNNTKNINTPTYKSGVDMNDDKAIEVALSILLAVALAQALNYFTVTVSDTLTWLMFSVFMITAILIIIYIILAKKLENRVREISRAISVGTFALFPFMIQRLTVKFYDNFQNAITNNWTTSCFLGYSCVLSITILVWGIFERNVDKDRGKTLLIFGGVALAFSLIALLVISRGVHLGD